jgi:rare lipoprotein A
MRCFNTAGRPAAMALLLLTALLEFAPAPASAGQYSVGTPYRVGGRIYVPREEFDYDRVGTASWYGADFHGRRTASGEIYNMHALTAAHPTLPLSTVVRVSNLDNGLSVVVRINDRGPYVGNRIIDLSRAGARTLGFDARGTTRVRVTVLREATLRLKSGGAIADAAAEAGERLSVTTSSRPRRMRARPRR